VGVVEDVRQSALDSPAGFDIYIAAKQVHPDGVPILRNNQFWMARIEGNPGAFRTAFVNQLRAVDPDVAIAGTGTMREYVDEWLRPRRFNLALFAAFSLTALFLALFGLYALGSYSVGQRTREIGLRMAMGATGRDVRQLVLRESLQLCAAGCAAGLLLVFLGQRWVVGVINGAMLDAAHVAALTASLVATAVIAAWAPARRAARIEPAVTLKSE
jgi:ABC-type antimicrobial peptide transport system permease subunit